MLGVVTGHRPNKLGNDYNYTSNLSYDIHSKMKDLILAYNITAGISGMALGIDTLWAIALRDMKIPWTAAIPFQGFQTKWPLSSQETYWKIIKDPTCTPYTVTETAKYSPTLLQKRNVWMVDQLIGQKGYLFAFWDGTTGGTYNCLQYASKRLHTDQIKIFNPHKLNEKITTELSVLPASKLFNVDDLLK